MSSSVWKGYLSFGLISVPIRLFAAARESHISFNQVHGACGSKTQQQLFCPTCDRTIERSELVKGYPIEKNKFLIVTPEDIQSLEPDSSEDMAITQFVKLDDVDPLYFESSYYTAPEDSGKRAYALLFEAMRKLNVAAIATVTMHQREQVVLVRPYDKGLILHTLYFEEEVREVPEFGDQGKVDVSKAEAELAQKFVQQLMGKFDPSEYKDEYRARVQDMLDKKQAGMKPEKASPRKQMGQVINLMDALKASMSNSAVPKKGPQRETSVGKKVATRARKAG
jgi:DNA end-binding protein Ku